MSMITTFVLSASAACAGVFRGKMATSCLDLFDQRFETMMVVLVGFLVFSCQKSRKKNSTIESKKQTKNKKILMIMTRKARPKLLRHLLLKIGRD